MRLTRMAFRGSICNDQSHRIADRLAFLWLCLVVLGIMILSFGKSRELTILGAGMISLAWGILIGYSISQRYA